MPTRRQMDHRVAIISSVGNLTTRRKSHYILTSDQAPPRPREFPRDTKEKDMQQSNALTARLLNTLEAAELLGLSPRTLEKHRTYGTGPLYRKLGGRVVYDGVDLKVWADKGRRASTSDFGTDTVYPAKRRTEKRQLLA